MKFLSLLFISTFSLNSHAITLVQQTAAATKTAQNDPSCVAIRPFYWEIGDKLSKLASGSIGISAPNSNSTFEIASASKWIFGAYVAQKRSGLLTLNDKNYLRFLSGYDQFTSCAGTFTVVGCLNSGTNSDQTSTSIGRFAYGGGHMQKLAVDLGLGDLTNTGLAKEINTTLGISGSYSTPQPAGGMEMSAQAYSVFLKKLLNNQLKLTSLLGQNPVCTTPSLCPNNAIFSPAPNGWKYSYGHWVELPEGAFSSPGKFGFYPWIDSSKQYYGMISRKSLSQSAYLDSYTCGQKIRSSFLNGK